MAMTRWSPVQDDMTRFVNEFLGHKLEADGPRVWQPRVDIEETDSAFVVRTELPGMKLEDIKITVEDSQLTIRGQKQRNEEKKGTVYHRVERVYGTFERSFELGHLVKSERIEATYRDGVLEIAIPKAEEARPREIPIKVAQ